MVTTAADIFVETLKQWGIEVIFGKPGEGVEHLILTLKKRQIRFIEVNHEETAALMASGYAMTTGKIGACLASAFPNGIRLLQGLLNAQANGQPVLVITGAHSSDPNDPLNQHYVSLEHLMSEVTRFHTEIGGIEQVEALANLSCRAALSERCVAYIAFPAEIQSQLTKPQKKRRSVPYQTAQAYAQRVRPAYENDLKEAAEILNSGKRVVILAGRGAINEEGTASAELEYLAGMLGAPVVKTLMGKTALPDDSEYSVGIIGPWGTKPAFEAVKACDTLLLIGTAFPYLEFIPRLNKARVVQLDLDPTRIGLRSPVEVGLVGDCQRTIKLLISHLEHRMDRNFLEKVQRGMKTWWKEIEAEGTVPDVPLKPQVVAWELGKVLPEEAILACDPGDITTWWSRYMPAKRGQAHLFSGDLASTGSALPYAIAAQVAYPTRLTVSFLHEEGLNVHLAEFVTCARYGLPLKVVLLKGVENTGQPIERDKSEETLSLSGYAQALDYVQFAKACGAAAWVIREQAECGKVLTEALAAPGASIIVAEVDSSERASLIQNETRPASKPSQSLVFEDGKQVDLNALVEKMRELL